MIGRLDEVAKAIGAHAGNKSDLGTPFFADRRYVPVPFSHTNFRKILPAGIKRKISFIDAGNMEIFASPGLSVHLVRACFSCFRDNKRVVPKNLPPKAEFFSVASAHLDNDNGEMQFSGLLVPADKYAASLVHELGNISLSSSDPTISQAGGFSATISVMGGVARRFMEWLYASKIIESELEEGDILVRDGALITSVKGEEGFAKKAYDAAAKQGVVLCACAKTSELLTSTGMPLTSSVQTLAEKNNITAPWMYYPVAKNNNPDHKGEIFVCNFYKGSRRAFRFEIEKGSVEKLSDEEKPAIFSAIAENSKDGAFLGYPYGLVDVDANSRISFKEGTNWRAMLLSMLKRRGAGDAAETLSNAVDAHDVLNRI